MSLLKYVNCESAYNTVHTMLNLSYCRATNPIWVNFTFRQAILCDDFTDHHIDFPKINFHSSAFMSFLPFSEFFMNPSIVLFIKTKSSKYINLLSTPFLVNSVTTSATAYKEDVTTLVLVASPL